MKHLFSYFKKINFSHKFRKDSSKTKKFLSSNLGRNLSLLFFAILTGGTLTALTSYAASISASNISYSNSTSGLTATNVQSAIDEIATDGLKSTKLSSLDEGTNLYYGAYQCKKDKNDTWYSYIYCAVRGEKTESVSAVYSWNVDQDELTNYVGKFCGVALGGYFSTASNRTATTMEKEFSAVAIGTPAYLVSPSGKKKEVGYQQGTGTYYYGISIAYDEAITCWKGLGKNNLCVRKTDRDWWTCTGE